MAKSFKFKTKIYYEDTDAGGIVYYANYLKYFERARTELVYSLGFNHKILKEEHGVFIIVKSCNIHFNKPVKFEDEVEVETTIKKISPVRLVLNQIAKVKDAEHVVADVELAVIEESGKPKKMPNTLFDKFKSCIW